MPTTEQARLAATARGDDTAVPRPWQRWLMLTVGVGVIVHSVVVALWLSPENPVRSEVGDSALASYVNPYFQQSTRAIDPGAQYADETFELRARVRGGDGELLETSWVNVTRLELESSGVVAPRIHRAARALATNLNAAVIELPKDLRPLVSDDYVDADLVQLEGKLRQGGATSDETRRYFASHYMATQYATLYASASFVGIVEQVQVRIGFRRVPPYSERDRRRLDDVPFKRTTLGWREAIAGNEAAQQDFDRYVGSLR